jgi:CheY-like chemotaxis protein
MRAPQRCKLHAIAEAWNDEVNETAKDCVDVLVIDDDAVMRELVADWLEEAGYRVRKAADCLAGLAQARQVAPALVVTDMCMPGPSGTAAVSRLKEQQPGVRVIAISGHFRSGQGVSAEAALGAGAARALAKPVKRGELIRAVAELLGAPA